MVWYDKNLKDYSFNIILVGFILKVQYGVFIWNRHGFIYIQHFLLVQLSMYFLTLCKTFTKLFTSAYYIGLKTMLHSNASGQKPHRIPLNLKDRSQRKVTIVIQHQYVCERKTETPCPLRQDTSVNRYLEGERRQRKEKECKDKEKAEKEKPGRD